MAGGWVKHELWPWPLRTMNDILNFVEEITKSVFRYGAAPPNTRLTGDPENKILNTSALCICLCLVPQSRPTLCDPWTGSRQAPLSMKFSRQEFWSQLPFHFLQGIFPTQESDPRLWCLLHWRVDSLSLLPYSLWEKQCNEESKLTCCLRKCL